MFKALEVKTLGWQDSHGDDLSFRSLEFYYQFSPPPLRPWVHEH